VTWTTYEIRDEEILKYKDMNKGFEQIDELRRIKYETERQMERLLEKMSM
jgi:hypothetical protein